MKLHLSLVLMALLVFPAGPVRASPVRASPVRASPVRASPAVVHALLFFSPACGHCHLVIEQVLPPLQEQYGEQLVVLGIDVTQTAGQKLFIAALQKFNLESSGVPMLVVGDSYLIGSREIPEKFPALIEAGLASGGIDWPTLEGLPDLLEEFAIENPEPVQLYTDASQASWDRKFARDPLGNGLAVLVLIGMIAALVWSVRALFSRKTSLPLVLFRWGIPLACLFGLIVAGYLAYVETQNVTAVCGPVGDCNTVQQSAYARLFGILPIGVLGVFGYLALLLAWGLAVGNQAGLATIALSGMALLGTLFSAVLTFLEPFVIGATCAWCLASAILVTLILLFSISVGQAGLQKLLTRL